MTRQRIGVGILGAGTAAQAVHLPTLSALDDIFEVRHISDVDAQLARTVATSVGCSWSSDEADILSDPAVEVVVICTPNQHHARQVVAACRAGKRAVLCEKPLATTLEESADILEASISMGVPVIPGTMLNFDPAVQQARFHWADLPEQCRLVRSTIYLPPNELMTTAATELVSAPMRPTRPAGPPTADVQAEILHGMLISLAGHNVPLLRDLMSADVVVRSATLLDPLGYLVTVTSGVTTAQLISVWPGQWPIEWTLEAYAPDERLTIRFPPSFIMAGSAVATLETESDRQEWEFDENGYLHEWRHVDALLHDDADPVAHTRSAVLDARFALDIATQAAALLLRAEG